MNGPDGVTTKIFKDQPKIIGPEKYFISDPQAKAEWLAEQAAAAELIEEPSGEVWILVSVTQSPFETIVGVFSSEDKAATECARLATFYQSDLEYRPWVIQ